jgi:hypothetical protein
MIHFWGVVLRGTEYLTIDGISTNVSNFYENDRNELRSTDLKR